VEKAYEDKGSWARKSILAASGMGKFSSDRSIREYADRIWGVGVCVVPDGTISV
jgi:starch phosphorylase